MELHLAPAFWRSELQCDSSNEVQALLFSAHTTEPIYKPNNHNFYSEHTNYLVTGLATL